MNELQPASVLRKTESGLAAIKVFDRSLVPKARTLLILIDGKKTVQELRKFSPDPTQISGLISELMAAGYIRLDDVAAPVANPEIIPTTAVAPKLVSGSLPDLKIPIRKVTRALEELLGPTSEGLCLQIEKCKTLEELNAKIQSMRTVVAQSRSEKKAEEFIAKVFS
jgi:hypothetical protein